MNNLENRIRRYIDVCIEDACREENRTNDVEYDYRIIKNHFLFAIKSKYTRVRRRVERRLLRNMKKNFNLRFHLLYPDPLHECDECFHSSRFDLYPQSQGVDPNYSVDEWVIFGKAYTIQAFRDVRKIDYELGKAHIDRLMSHGYPYENYGGADVTWDVYKKAYHETYGCDPIDTVIECWPEDSEGEGNGSN